MIKFFKNRSIWQKIALVLAIIILIEFILTCPVVRAEEDELGGKLFRPVMDLVVGLGDGCIGLLQNVVYNIPDSFVIVDRDGNFWSIFWGVVAAVAVIIGSIALAAATGGISLVIQGLQLTIGGSIFLGFIVHGWVAGMMPTTLYLPTFEISPEKIFTNKVPMLSVNFFEEAKDEFIGEYEVEKQEKVTIDDVYVYGVEHITEWGETGGGQAKQKKYDEEWTVKYKDYLNKYSNNYSKYEPKTCFIVLKDGKEFNSNNEFYYTDLDEKHGNCCNCDNVVYKEAFSNNYWIDRWLGN